MMKRVYFLFLAVFKPVGFEDPVDNRSIVAYIECRNVFFVECVLFHIMNMGSGSCVVFLQICLFLQTYDILNVINTSIAF
jgi:hypothetical protein